MAANDVDETSARGDETQPDAGWRGLLFDVHEDGRRSVSAVLPVFVGLAAVCVFAMVALSQCAVEQVSTLTKDDEVPTVAPATPSFEKYQQSGCVPVGDETLKEIDESLLAVRQSVGQSSSFVSRDGEYIAVSIVWDDRRVEDPSVIFFREDGGELWSVSTSARRLTTIPDGRKEHKVSPIDDGALAAQNCIS